MYLFLRQNQALTDGNKINNQKTRKMPLTEPAEIQREKKNNIVTVLPNISFPIISVIQNRYNRLRFKSQSRSKIAAMDTTAPVNKFAHIRGILRFP